MNEVVFIETIIQIHLSHKVILSFLSHLFQLVYMLY